MKEWFTQFVEWIQTSPVAAEENAAKNNHGLAYDVQLTAYALYIGNKELAIQILKNSRQSVCFLKLNRTANNRWNWNAQLLSVIPSST